MATRDQIPRQRPVSTSANHERVNPTNREHWRAYGPLHDEHDAQAVRTELQAQGVPGRSVGIVALRPSAGIEQHPLARWTLATASRHALRTMICSLPVLIGAYIGLFWTLLDQFELALVAAFGAAPIAGLIGFAQSCALWSPLTVLDDGRFPEAGFLVVTAGFTHPFKDPVPPTWSTPPSRPNESEPDESATTSPAPRLDHSCVYRR